MFPLQNILVPLGVFAMVVLILWFSHVTRRRAQEQRAEIIRRMIEKFSTGEAFAQAIQGPVGSKLASALALESEKPSKKWKGLFVPASILTFMGFGFSILALVRDEDFLIPAVIIPDYSSRKHKMSKRARHVESNQRVTGYPQKTAGTRPG